MASVLEATTYFERVLDMPLDAVEFCPVDGFFDLFVVGQYFLNAESQEAQGGLVLYRHHFAATKDHATSAASGDDVKLDAKQDVSDVVSVDEITRVGGDAVFDVKWARTLHQNQPWLATVTRTGALCCYRLKDPDDVHPVCLELSSTLQISARNKAALFLDFRRSDANRLVCSLADGSVSVCDCTDADGWQVQQSWSAHDYEAWTAAFQTGSRDVIYTGADDALLKGWDLRAPLRKPTFVNKSHDAGVCCVACSPHEEQVFATGSYDEKLRIWDARQTSGPTEEVELGSGVWRVKFHPQPARRNDLLTGCMRNGFHVLTRESIRSTITGNLDGLNLSDTATLASDPDTVLAAAVKTDASSAKSSSGSELRKTCSYMKHTDLAYGCDWSHDPCAPRVIGSCSFYDKTLRVWEEPEPTA